MSCLLLGNPCRDLILTDVPLISVIDDDDWAREGIKELVLSLGYQVVAFASAEEFVDSHTIDRTSCIVTDLQMPGLSGVDLQELLRTGGYDTPIIVVTAYPDEKNRVRAIAGGAVGFLNKPFDERSLIECLGVALRSVKTSDGPRSE